MCCPPADDKGPPLALEEAAFFSEQPGVLPLYQALRKELLALHHEAVLWVQKSQISFRAPHPYAWVWLPPRGGMKKGPLPSLALTFAAPFPIDSPRVFAKVEAYPGRFTHHLQLHSVEQLDYELLGWLRMSLVFRNP